MIEQHEAATICCKHENQGWNMQKMDSLSGGVTLYNELPTKTQKIKKFYAFRKDVFNLYM